MVVGRMIPGEDNSGMDVDESSDNISDQDYLILRSNQALKQGNVWEAKTWMLTARALFPNNFDIQFEAYINEKKNGNVVDCARNFSVLFDKFPKEQKMIEEINNLMKFLRNQNPDKESVEEGEEKYYLEMFEKMTDDVQKKLIVFAAERSENALDHCKLMLILVKRFTDEMNKYGEKLIETLNEAETREDANKQQLRTLLVTEVLPTVLNHDKIKINSKLLLNNLYKAQEYILGVNISSSRSHLKTEPGWSLLYNLTHCVARILGWPAVPHVSPDAAVIPIDQFLNILSSSPTPMFQVISCLVLHTVSEYSALSQVRLIVIGQFIRILFSYWSEVKYTDL